jgi:cytochrome c5
MRSIAFLVFASLVSCGGSTADDTPTNDTGVTQQSETGITASAPPCDVDAIVERECRTCHGATPKFGAPMALVTRAELQAHATKVKERINLPAETVGRMPQRPNAPLSSGDLATLNAWLDGGTPARTTECTKADAGVEDAPPVRPLSCTPDVKVRSGSKWTMPKDTRDVYTCYGFDLTVASKKHIIGVAPAIQNSKIVHHILLMQSDSAVSSTPQPCSPGAISNYRMLYAWAPGVGSFELPKEAGLPANTGTSHFVVQVHYNNIAALAGETDDSGFDFCTTESLRPNDADVLAFGSMNFTIDPKATLNITASWTIPGLIPTVHAIGAFPHMHQLGKKIATTLVRADGSTADLGTDAAFDFANQFFTPLADIVIKPGDTVKTNCIWENPTSRTVRYGENTEDEMCYSFTMYYPKITTALWRWGAPAALARTTVN